MPTNDPHPTARALVEAQKIGQPCRCRDMDILRWGHSRGCEQAIALALTAAHDAGRREGREEMRECLRAVREIASQHPLPDTPAYLSMPWLQVVRLIDKALA